MISEKDSSQIKILGLAGSLAPHSRSVTALQLALEAAQEAGAQTQLLNFALPQLPMFLPGRGIGDYTSTEAEAISNYLAAVTNADALIFSAGIYHGSVTGLWKNGIDFLELLPREPVRYLTGKPVGLITVSGGPMAATHSMEHLKHIVQALRGDLVAESVALGGARHLFNGEGILTNNEALAKLATLGQIMATSIKAKQPAA